MSAEPQRQPSSLYDDMLDEDIVESARCGQRAAEEYLINKYKNFVRAKARSVFSSSVPTAKISSRRV